MQIKISALLEQQAQQMVEPAPDAPPAEDSTISGYGPRAPAPQDRVFPSAA